MRPYRIFDDRDSSHGRHLRYCMALMKARELASKFKKALTVVRNWTPMDKTASKSLATVYANGDVWFESAGRFCDEHDDCHADFLLGQACFARRLEVGTVKALLEKPAPPRLNCWFSPAEE